MNPVIVREELRRLPTEPWDRIDPHPDLFAVFRRDWRAFPYPRLLPSGPREMRSYRLLRLENEYLAVSVMPDLGGRLYRAVDKLTGMDLFYVNTVVKPRPLAVRGPWVSGGIEYNFPVGHHVWTISPVQAQTGRGPDGSGWIETGETDQITGMTWHVRQILRPGARMLETRITLENPTPHAQSYYYWSNAAVPDTPSTRLLVPYDWVQFHDAEAPPFRWPVLAGQDISWTKNIGWVVSLFGRGSHGNAFGAYDTSRDFGICHVADPDIMPGKKIFSWGYGPSRERWTRELTDHDGAYLEIQAGLFDTQQDLDLFPPGERRTWREYWLPAPGMGGWTAASPNALCHWVHDSSPPEVRIFSAVRQSLPGRVEVDGRVVDESTLELSPDEVAHVRFGLSAEAFRAPGVEVVLGPMRFRPHEILADEAGRRLCPTPPSLDDALRASLPPRPDVPNLDDPSAVLRWAERLRLRRLPVEAERFYRRAMLLDKSGRAAEKHREFRAALDRPVAGEHPPGAVEYFTGRWDEAIEIWKLRAEDDPIAAHSLGLALLEQRGDRFGAADAFLAAHRTSPHEPLYLLRSALLFLSLHRVPETRELLDRFGATTHPDIARLWVLLRVEEENWEEALRLMMGASFDVRHGEIGLAWLWVVVHTRLGEMAFSAEKKWHYFRAAQFVPAGLGDDTSVLGYGTEALSHLGDSFAELGNMADARQAWERAAREPRGYLDSLSHWRAKALEALGYTEEARRIWTAMREQVEWRLAMRHPARAYLLYLKSLAAVGLGQEDVATSAFHAAWAAGLTWFTRCRAAQDVSFY